MQTVYRNVAAGSLVFTLLCLGSQVARGQTGGPVPLNSTWNYLVTPTAPVGDWTALNFDDSTWLSGQAELGYGDSDERTLIGFGPDSANRYITTYFRKTFTVADPSLYGNLTMTLVYDDGAVVYLNGVEIYRLNMPAGTVTWSTTASGAADYTPDVSTVSPTRLVAGTNIIAVEMHQSGGTSSDVSFNLELLGSIAPTVAITSPAAGSTFDVPVNFTLSANATDADGTITQVEFMAGDLLLGVDTSAPYSITVTNLIEGTYDLRATAVDNAGGRGNSSPVSITVNDPTTPVVQRAQATDLTHVTVVFSKRVAPGSALATQNYQINQQVMVSGAEYLGTGSNIVVLTTSPLTRGVSYVLTVNNVADFAGRMIAANTQVPFQVTDYSFADIGTVATPGTSTASGSGYDLTTVGTNIWGNADQFYFAWKQVEGDFDVEVRVDAIDAENPWAKAGLMARETLTANSRHASTLATPNVGGAFFVSRSTTGSNSIALSPYPVGYPNTWLRLKRAGTNFTGYIGYDGANWIQLGSTGLINPASSFYLGLAVASGTTNALTTVQMRDSGDSSGEAVVRYDLPFEPLGPAARSTGLIISEIMYHPKHSNALEFVELFNAGLVQEDLTGFRLTGDIEYAFPAGTTLGVGEFLVVARDPQMLAQSAVLSPGAVLGPWSAGTVDGTNALPDDVGRVRLRNNGNGIPLEVNYRGNDPWPIAADGTGHSLVLARPSYGQDNPRSWGISQNLGGSPGRMEPVVLDPLQNIVINEFFANSELPEEDFIELYNHGNQAVDLSGVWLSDDRDTNKFRIPDGTTLPARGFVSFTQTQLGFALSSRGERIYLVNPPQTRVLDVVAFDAQAIGVSSGRYPDGAPGFHELGSRTPGATNSALYIRDIVINEIMLNPISGKAEDEYVELYNRGNASVDVSGWRFTSGIDFLMPGGTVIPSRGYLVVGRSVGNLLSKYSQLNVTNTVGPFDGNLANSGERLVLSMPEYFTVTNGSLVLTQASFIAVDDVVYDDSGRWASWVDGGGSSLELLDPNSDNRFMANWGDSDETQKSVWTNVSVTANADHVYMVNAEGATMNEVQVMILGAGEMLMDDVDVHAGAVGQNLVANGSFTSGVSGWLIQGNHVKSGLEPAGPNNPSDSMRIRASAGGDNGANRVEKDLNAPLSPNALATISGRFRWLRGFPIVLMRVHGGGLEAVGTLPVPNNLGSPGLPNSRLVANIGPAISEVKHAPPMPAANEPVVVTARVSDPDGIASVEVRYRLDPGTSLTSVVMKDDGTGGDVVAGDGLFSGTIPGQGSGTLVAFRVEAKDARSPQAARVFPPDAPNRECLVRFGDPQMFGAIGTYRLWMTAANLNTWTTRERLSNEALDGTMIYGNYRIIYNMGARYRGSPFTRNPSSPIGVGVAANYVWNLPEDDLLMGSDELNLDSLEPGGSSNVRDVTALRELTSFSMVRDLGLPYSHMRFVHVIINGVSDTARNIPVYSDSQQPNGEYISMWFPGENDGDIYKVDDWFEFNDTPGMTGNKSASLEVFNTTLPGGVTTKKQARYRWNWEKKFNGGELDDDYTSLYEVVDALNAPDANYVGMVENVMEVDQWLTMLAFRHVVGDWDGYGYNRGKNQFVYRPKNGKINMLLWDLDFSLGCNSGHGTSQDLFSVALGGATASDNMPEVARMYNHPYFRRAYLQALQRIALGPMQEPNYLPLLDARYRALLANGVTTVTSPFVNSGAQGIPVSTWINQRRTYMLNQLPTAGTNFTITGGAVQTVSNNTVLLRGTAGLPVKYIRVNGVDYLANWSFTTGTQPTTWSVRMVVDEPTTEFQIAGVSPDGTLITGQSNVTVNYTGPIVAPEEMVVFTELMYNPAAPDASFVELFNRSGTASFDLSGWVVNGLDYTFPQGTILNPKQYFVLAGKSGAFTAAYPGTPLFGEFDGSFDPDGETLTLLKPAGAGQPYTVIDRVRYEPTRPWPIEANGGGPSLQLIDPEQDNARVSNWSDGAGWRFYSTNLNVGRPTSPYTNLFLFLDVPGEVYIDDLSIVVSNTTTELLVNGDFEAPLAGTWSLGTNYATSELSTAIKFNGNSALRLVSSARSTGLTPNNTITQNITGKTETNGNYTISLWYLPTTNASKFNFRISSTARFELNVQPPNRYSPGLPNMTLASLPAYDPVWLNEVQPQPAGGGRPWIELFNAGTSAVSLDGYYLADNYTTNLLAWAFPAGASVQPGEHKVVYVDGQPGLTTATEWHTSFLLPPGTGQVALTRVVGGSPQVTDYLTYAAVPAELSFGDYPDGQPFYRRLFFTPSPGAVNTAPPVDVFINEWMAANTLTLDDPDETGFNYEDWFELYNAGSEIADLSGYWLSDTLTNRTHWRVPAGTVIPPGGYLLVWADNDTSQNDVTNRVDLHAGFQLSRDGEALSLFAPDGTAVDQVSFGGQTNDVSQGRYPNGMPGTSYTWFLTPTPRSMNVVEGGGDNHAPILGSVPTQTVVLGQALQFALSATDPDPGQTLSYALTGTWPAGASLSAGGQFLWTPSASQTPSTNVFSVRVTDSGTPPLSATGNFTVYVVAPPQVAITRGTTGGEVKLAFGTVAGKRYQVRFKNSLSEAVWQSLGQPQTATGTTLEVSDTIGTQPHRFYLIEIVP